MSLSVKYPENTPETDMAQLRATLQQLERGYVGAGSQWALSTSFDVLDQYLTNGGLSSHCVHELIGLQAYGFALRLLSQLKAGSYCLWCRIVTAHSVPYGSAFDACGVNVENIVFVQCQTNKELLWAMEEGLRSGAVSIVIGEPQDNLNLTSSRRLQLAAEAGASLGLIINADHTVNLPHNALYSRWQITPAPTKLSERFAWNVALLRMRRAKPEYWRVFDTGYHD